MKTRKTLDTENDVETNGHTGEAANRLVSDLKLVTHDAQALLEATADAVGDRVQAARDRLRLALDRSKETYEDLADQSVAAAKSAARKADGLIRDNPYTTMGIALGVGLIVGFLVTRRQSKD